MILGLLLVLRGLLGDAMAMGVAPAMPTQPMAVMSASHSHHDAAGAGQHGGVHHDHSATTQQPYCCDEDGLAHAEHPAGCLVACGICHSAFSAPAWMTTPADVQNGPAQPHHCTHFASATAAQAIKPPIS